MVTLKTALVLFFGLLLLFQNMSLPGQFANMAQLSPEMALLQVIEQIDCGVHIVTDPSVVDALDGQWRK